VSATPVLDVARRELGTVESPANSNRTKYGAAYGMNGVAWCAIFTWWCFREAGLSGLVPKTAYTPTLANWFKQRGRWGIHPRRGALVLFDFPNDGVNRISHVGIVEAVNSDGSIVTIEGNTSGGTSGSQRDGGGVWRRTRKTGIVGYGYPAYPAAPSPGSSTVLRRGDKGVAVGKLQSTLKAWYPNTEPFRSLKVDNDYGPATQQAVMAFQKRAGLAVDGIAGPVTLRTLGIVL
jgi:hypothetical protein